VLPCDVGLFFVSTKVLGLREGIRQLKEVIEYQMQLMKQLMLSM
jgi:hypothetical protein